MSTGALGTPSGALAEEGGAVNDGRCLPAAAGLGLAQGPASLPASACGGSTGIADASVLAGRKPSTSRRQTSEALRRHPMFFHPMFFPSDVFAGAAAGPPSGALAKEGEEPPPLVRLRLPGGVQRLAAIARPRPARHQLRVHRILELSVRHLPSLALHPASSCVCIGETVTKRLTRRCPTFRQGFGSAGKHYRPRGRHPEFLPLTFSPGSAPGDRAVSKPCNVFLHRLVFQASGGSRTSQMSRRPTEPCWVGFLNNPSDGLFLTCRPPIVLGICVSSSFWMTTARRTSMSSRQVARRSCCSQGSMVVRRCFGREEWTAASCDRL